jgi:hypothetical protein
MPTREAHGHLIIVKNRQILFEALVAERKDVSFVNGPHPPTMLPDANSEPKQNR